MRMFHPTPTAQPLPFDHMYSGMGARETAAAIELNDAAVVQFDQLLHEIHADAPREVIESRLERVRELRALLDDEDWDADEATHARIGKLLSYIDREDDLIADRIPVLGQLDDVLLIELAWPAFADEAEDYRDFIAYRDVNHPDGAADERRAAWVRERLDEVALWQHAMWVREQHYAPWNLPRGLFRVA